MQKILICACFLSTLITATRSFIPAAQEQDFLNYTADPKNIDIKLYWKNDQGKQLKSLEALKDFTLHKGERLLFAMNAGMYQQDGTPLGLFIEKGNTVNPINKRKGFGNFYLQPNGIFYINSSKVAGLCTTGDFINKKNIEYATQSGPMLVINGTINSLFKKGSANLNIRNGVGILPNNKILFVMSKTPVNFYDFAAFFKKAGCNNALYLDGFVCQTYLPGKNWVHTGGNFGVIIGAVEKNNP